MKVSHFLSLQLRRRNHKIQKPMSMHPDTIRTSGIVLSVAKYEINTTISLITIAIVTPRKSLLNYYVLCA